MFPEKTKVIFFDLEYYVPEKFRQRKTLNGTVFSAGSTEHKILGGSFQTYYPLLNKFDPMQAIWEWNANNSEREVLGKILDFLKKEWKGIQGKKHISPILCGIGISYSDIPALLIKMIEHKLDTPENIYELICGFRQLDLATTTFCQFSSQHKYFAYPKSKALLLQKYLGDRPMDSGTSVWKYYDDKNFKQIENRNSKEIDDCIKIYHSMFDKIKQNESQIKRLKKLEKEISFSKNVQTE